jgi:AcrR family transcriptional regulator
MLQNKHTRAAGMPRLDATEIDAKAQIKEYKEALIVDAAAKLFHEKGFQRTTIDDIAAALGYTKPFIYTYFSSKYSILERVFDRIYEEVVSAASIEGLEQAPPDRRLRHFVSGYIRKNLEQPEFSAVLLEDEKSLSAEKLEDMRVKQRRFDDQLAALIDQCARAAGVRISEPKLAALSVSGMVRCLHRWYSPNGRLSIEQVCEELTDVAMRIAGIPAEPLPTPQPRAARAVTACK